MSRVRIVGALAVMATALALPVEAGAGTYTVVQCHAPPPTNYQHEATVSTVPPVGVYEVRTDCSNAGGNNSIRIDLEAGAAAGNHGRVTWSAPPGTVITGVEISARLRRDGGQRARIYMANAAGGIAQQFGTGGIDPTGFKPYSWTAPAGGGWPKLVADLACVNDNCGYAQASNALAHVREVRIKVEDRSAPRVEFGGSLVASGWLAGTHSLGLRAEDSGAGLESLVGIVNVTPVLRAQGQCDLIHGTALSRRLSPCDSSLVGQTVVDTRELPDGSNTVWACARDYGSQGFGTCFVREALIDNTPPKIAFRSRQLPEDPDLVTARVADDASGLAFDSMRDLIRYRRVGNPTWRPLATELKGGALYARVDSSAEPPGEYEFRAEIRDRADNESVSTAREDGTPMRLTFPLRAAPQVDATLPGGTSRLTVPYRRGASVSGRLSDPEGVPLAGEEVRVLERFDEGALIDRRVRHVETDQQGRFRSKLPGGPSREIEVHYDGSRAHQSASSAELDLNVKSKVELKLRRNRVRAGSRAHFRGAVGRYFARLPEGGKLVELQVKEGKGRWNTLGEAQGTSPKGRIRLSHRFRAYYTRPVTFVFRLKATKEGRWPYRAPTTSKPRRLTVLPKR